MNGCYSSFPTLLDFFYNNNNNNYNKTSGFAMKRGERFRIQVINLSVMMSAINRALLTPLVLAFNKPWAIYTQPAEEIDADLNCPYISTSNINDSRKYCLQFRKNSPVQFSFSVLGVLYIFRRAQEEQHHSH
jgi:hypothetical protein